MKKLLCLMGGALLFLGIKAQKIRIEPYNIGDRVSNFPLNKVVNYNDSSTTISTFGHKLVILDFWGTHCGSCIKMFPKEDSLQQTLKNYVQFILVTSDDSATVTDFLLDYNKSHPSLSLPIVTSDILIAQMFKHMFVPHYVWISPDGRLLAQTSSTMINKESILAAIAEIRQREHHLRTKNFQKSYFNFPVQNNAQSAFFNQYKN